MKIYLGGEIFNLVQKKKKKKNEPKWKDSFRRKRWYNGLVGLRLENYSSHTL